MEIDGETAAEGLQETYKAPGEGVKTIALDGRKGARDLTSAPDGDRAGALEA